MKKGGLIIIDGSGGYVVHERSPVRSELGEVISRMAQRCDYEGFTRLYEEKGVYKFYVRLARGEFGLNPFTDEEATAATSTAVPSASGPAAAASSSGGRRRG